MQNRRVTGADVARRAGVSISAVSYALNDKPGVSDATRARIRAVADELGWRPNTAARALNGARAGVIGFILSRPARSLGTEAFYAQLIAGLQSGLSGSHVALSMLIASSLEEELDTYRQWRHDGRVDGVLITDPRLDDPRLAFVESIGLPAVMMGSHPSGLGHTPTVWVDDAAATTLALGYLWALGHRRIAHVAGHGEFEHTGRRAGALAEFVTQRGLSKAESITTDYSEAAGESVTRQLLSNHEPPTAIVYDNDVLAVAGLRAALEMGIRVPADLSIISFEDSILVRLARPALTALTRDMVAFGEITARLLLARIDADQPVDSVQGPPVNLTVRDSTAPLDPPRS